MEAMALTGGLIMFLSMLLNFILRKYSAHSFYMKAMKRLYYARTHDEDLLLESTCEREKPSYNAEQLFKGEVFEDNLIEEVESHKQIRVSPSTFRDLFFGCAS